MMTSSRRIASLLLVLPSLLAAGGCRRMRFPQLSDDYREYAYVANSGDGTVSVLDLVNFRPDRTLRVGDGPSAIAANPARNEIYVVNTVSGTVSVIDAASNHVVAAMRVHQQPHSIVLDPAGDHAFVVNTGANTVSTLDLKNRREVGTTGTGEQPGKAALSPDGRSLLVGNSGSGSVSIYDVTSNATPRLRAAFDGCPGASDIVVLNDSSKAFVSCPGSNRLLSVGLASAPDSWPAKQDPDTLRDRVLARLRVGMNPGHLTLKPDSGELFVSNFGSASISEVSTFTNEVGGTYTIGTGPANGVVSPDNSVLWVSNSGADSVSMYSIDEGRMTTAVHTGPQPGPMALSPAQPVLLVADQKSSDVAVIRTRDTNGPELFTMLPVGAGPSAIAIKAFKVK